MTNIKDNRTALLVKQVALKHGVKTNYVYKVIRGDRENESILNDFMELRDAHTVWMEQYQNSKLIQAVRELVPL